MSTLQKTQHVIAVIAAVVLTACGGGGTDEAGNGASDLYEVGSPSVTYLSHGGLTWSSTTAATYIWPSGFFSGLEVTASAYCTQKTCTEKDSYGNFTACTFTNFNKQEGWRLPSQAELESLHASNIPLTNWVLGPTWTENGGVAVNLSTGVIHISGTSTSSKSHVTCVK